MDKKILVIDDDKGILSALKLVFDEFNLNSESISDASETFEKVNNYHPDLIILDLLLSGLDGRNICNDLKNNDNTKNIPVLLLSAHSSIAKTAIESGADDFLAKPFDLNELMKKVKKLLK